MEFTYDQPWRKAYESVSASAWTISAMVCLWMIMRTDLKPELLWAMLITAIAFAAVRWGKTYRIWRTRAGLLGHEITCINDQELDNKLKKHHGAVWLGWGYDWKPVHSQYLYDMKRYSFDDVQAPSWFIKYLELMGNKFPKNQVGSAWIHGMELNEHDICLPLKHLAGNTVIFATTGSMKTRLLELVCAQTIRRNPHEALIVIDPKGDKELLSRMKFECKKAGREQDFKFFHPAFPSKSVRIDPLKNWTRPTEIASRVAALIPSETGGDAFTAFSWRAINTIADGLVYVEERPNLAKLRHYITGGIDQLLEKTLVAFFAREVDDWRTRIEPYIDQASTKSAARQKPTPTTPDKLMGMVMFYKTELSEKSRSPVVDNVLSMFSHNRDHYAKLIASLLPVLDMLCSGDLESLLSPDPFDTKDMRPIVDTAKIIEAGHVLYVGLDSLSDATVGEAIGSITLADITAVCGDRYNFAVDDKKTNVIVDEAAECVNRPFVQMLNKGRGAGLNVMFAAQSLPDFIAKTGNEAMARQILANANNLIVGRTKDSVTAEYAVEMFGKTFIKTLMHTQSTTSGSKDGEFAGYGGGYGERLIETEAELFPMELLGQIPNLECIASLSGGQIKKIRLPILEPVPTNELVLE